MNENHKTVKQAFHGIPKLEQKLKTDEVFNFVVMDAIKICVGKVRSGEHENQYQTYDYLKSLGFEDEECIFIYGIICSQVYGDCPW